jgi:hypothetical protein
VHPQIAFLDAGGRPHAGDQLVLAQHFAGALQQRQQQVEGASAQAHGLPAVVQRALGGHQAVGAEQDSGIGRSHCVVGMAGAYPLRIFNANLQEFINRCTE